MRLNNIKPAEGSRPAGKRVGRGIGSGLGKTCGRGHKGQHSRSGGFHKVGFEGGQMPLQRRLPKIGFRSLKAGETAEVRLHELNTVTVAGQAIDIHVLKAANLVPQQARYAKVVLAGVINSAVTLKGISVTKGARVAIEAAGGSVEE